MQCEEAPEKYSLKGIKGIVGHNYRWWSVFQVLAPVCFHPKKFDELAAVKIIEFQKTKWHRHNKRLTIDQ